MAELDDRLSAAPRPASPTPRSPSPNRCPSLRKRARRHRTRRALAATTACALACGALAGVLIVTHDGHDAPNDLRLLAPNVLLGDIDAVVLSNTYDENGARGRIPTSVRDQLATIPGVQEASGIVQRFVPITRGR